MTTKTIITLSKDDLNTLKQASEILQAIQNAIGRGVMPTTKDIETMGDINSYRDGKFIRRTMQNIFANDLNEILRLDETL